MVDVEAESETYRQAGQERCLTQSGELPNSHRQTKTRKLTGKLVIRNRAEKRSGGQKQAKSKPGGQSKDNRWRVIHTASKILHQVRGTVQTNTV